MLMGYLIDGLCRIALAVLGIAALAFVVSCIVIVIGEKKKWW